MQIPFPNTHTMSSQTLLRLNARSKITPEMRQKYLKLNGITLPGDFEYTYQVQGIKIIIDDTLALDDIRMTNS